MAKHGSPQERIRCRYHFSSSSTSDSGLVNISPNRQKSKIKFFLTSSPGDLGLENITLNNKTERHLHVTAEVRSTSDPQPTYTMSENNYSQKRPTYAHSYSQHLPSPNKTNPITRPHLNSKSPTAPSQNSLSPVGWSCHGCAPVAETALWIFRLWVEGGAVLGI